MAGGSYGDGAGAWHGSELAGGRVVADAAAMSPAVLSRMLRQDAARPPVSPAATRTPNRGGRRRGGAMVISAAPHHRLGRIKVLTASPVDLECGNTLKS